MDDAFFPRAPRLRATLSSALDWSVFSLRRAVNDLANSLSLERTQLVDEYWGTNTGALLVCESVMFTRPQAAAVHTRTSPTVS